MKFSDELFDAIAKRLKQKKETISAAESVTSGFIQFSLSQMKDASQFYKGGITAFTLEEKVKLLNIDAEEAEKCDCVSRDIAEKMALNVATLFGTDWSIGVTGYATPVEESDFKTFCYFAVAYKNQILISEKLISTEENDGAATQTYFTEWILRSLNSKLDH